MRSWLSAFAFLVASVSSGAPALTGPQMNIDIPPHQSVRAQPFWLAGWAIDTDATTGTGIGSVQVWGFPIPGSPEDAVFFGVASYGDARPDVGAVYGEQFTNSSWALLVAGQPAGTYEIHVYAFSTVTGTYNQERQVTVTVLATNPRMSVDIPQGATALQPFNIAGWAIDVGASQGTGVDALQVWAHRIDGPGGADQLLGAAAYGGTRPDVGAAFGTQFTNSGYGFTVGGLAAGRYRFTVWARSTVTGTFNQNTPFEIEVDPVVATPTFSPAGGTYSADQSVVISTATGGAVVRYTTDGSTPTNASPEVPPTLTVETPTRILAKAFHSGWIDSGTATAAYDFQAAAPTFSVASGTYGAEQTVYVTSSTQQAVVRYTTDGSDPTAASPVIPSPYTVDATLTLKAVGFRAGWTPSPTVTATYVLQPATPVFSVAPGSYSADFYVTVSSATPSTTRRYTTDGSDPTASSPVLVGNYYVGGTVTVKVKAFRAGWTPSATATASYVLQPPPPTASPAAGTYDLGQEVNLSVADVFATIHYTTDGTTPTTASPIFSPVNPLVLSGPITLRAKSFRSNYTPSTELIQAYVTRVAKPTMSPSGGEYPTSPTVTMTTATTGATIRYTLSGNVPTENSTAYSSPFSVPLDSTVTAKAFKTGWAESEASTVEVYVSNAPVPVSAGTVSPSPTASAGFTSVNGTAVFDLSGAFLSSAPGAVFAYRAQTVLPVIIPGPTSFQVGGLVEGSNQLDIYGADSQGLPFELTSTVWAGSRSVYVTVRNRSQQALSGAWVDGALGEEYTILASGTTSGSGVATLSNTPANNVLLVTAYAVGYRPRSVLVNAGQTSATVTLDEDNNDFSAGLTGWTNYAGANANIVAHSETFQGWVACPTCVVRLGDSSGGTTIVTLGQAPAAPPDPDYDLMVETINTFAPQTVVRRFAAMPGISKVRVRYRFATYERFSTQPANDTFLVRLTNTTTGAVVQEAATVFGLWAQLDSLGATGWRTLDLPVGADDDVEVTLSTQNASDAAFDSLILGDVITEQGLRVPAFELYDHTNPTKSHARQSLNFLSISRHTFDDGKTRIDGKIKVIGELGDSLQSVTLDVLNGTTVWATAPLAASAASGFLNTSFSTTNDRTVEIATPKLLFEIPSGQFPASDPSSNGNLSIRMTIISSQGHVFVLHLAEPGVNTTVGRQVQMLVNYVGSNRFSARDNPICVTDDPGLQFYCGGDGWALPQNAIRAAALGTGVYFNDFSNMNAGRYPPHGSHHDGRDVDAGWCAVTGCFGLTEDSATKLVALLTSPAGAAIDHVLVTVDPLVNTAFWNKIKPLLSQQVIDDSEIFGPARIGSKMRTEGRIRYYQGHIKHFHIRWRQ